MTTHTDDFHGRLEGLARAATPGPWSAFTDDSGSSPHTNIVAVVPRTACVVSLPGRDKREADIHFIAAANPQAILKLIAENRAYREALTPSGDTKAAYHGDFSWSEWETAYDEHGGIYEDETKRTVPWTTVKEIMAAIRARAALTPIQQGAGE